MSLDVLLRRGLVARPRPMYAGAGATIRVAGRTIETAAVGEQLRYADLAGTVLPVEERLPVTESTLFDIASLTKLFVAVALMSLVQEGALELDRPVRHYLPAIQHGTKSAITLRQLLTHTSGLPEDLPLWRYPQRTRKQLLLDAAVSAEPGSIHRYSCVGYVIAGMVGESVCGISLAELVQTRVCRPLGLGSTMYLPGDAVRHRIAATEDESGIGSRAMVRGEVHDEMAWALGGVAGNAGIFSTVDDIATFGEAVLADGGPLLCPATMHQMLRAQRQPQPDGGYRQGFGFRLDDERLSEPLGPGAIGHTGFTGTSLVIDPARSMVLVLLSNRVHPDRSWADLAPFRSTLAGYAAGLLPAGRDEKMDAR